jgi:hypothetical protein
MSVSCFLVIWHHVAIPEDLMDDCIRYAIYLIPDAPLCVFGAGWLGWDIETGRAVPHPAIPDLPQPLARLTAAARPYGFHATIKPPFRLAPDRTPDALAQAVAALAATCAAPVCDGLDLTHLDGFLALTPQGDTTDLDAMAARVVADLDGFRAPAPPEEIARRRAAGLTPAQDAHLLRWGYPYVMDQFRCHFTLTGRVSVPEAAMIRTTLDPILGPLLPQPFRADSLCLVGEQVGGGFRLLHRYALSG